MKANNLATILFALATAGLAGSGCTRVSDDDRGRPPAPRAEAPVRSAFTPLRAPPQRIVLGRCHMNVCGWHKLTAMQVRSAGDGDGLLIDAVAVYGESSHPGDDPNYPSQARQARIDWSEDGTRFSIACSYRRPRFIEAGQETVLPLNANGPPGALESAVQLYFALCHSYFDGSRDGIVTFGYDVPAPN